jgi:hypothetical protein
MFRFPLWLLAIVLSALGIWLAGRSHEARAQRRCVGEIQARGGRVYYDNAACQCGMPAGASPHSRLLVRLCGEDFLHDVIRVDLPADIDGIDFDGLPFVEMVLLHGDDVDDEDVLAVARLPRLKHLKIVSHGRYGYCRETKISDKSLELLGRMPALESVALEAWGLSPQGVELLLQAPQLKSAKIYGLAWDGIDGVEVPDNVRVEFSRSLMVHWHGPPYEDQIHCGVVDQSVRTARSP